MKQDLQNIINEIENCKIEDPTIDKFYKLQYIQNQIKKTTSYYNCDLCSSTISRENRYNHLKEHHYYELHQKNK